MDLHLYQKMIETFDQSPEVKRPLYHMIGMADELGEIATAILRFEYENKSMAGYEKIVDELGDFLWYFTRYATYQDVKISEIQFNTGYPGSLFINSGVLAFLQVHSALQIITGFEKKVMRGDAKVEFNAQDALTYVYNMFLTMISAFGVTMEELAERNYNKLRDRWERGVIKGSGDDR